MKRRKFLITSSTGLSLVSYSSISIRPSVSMSQLLQTPNPDKLTSSIDFSISSFNVDGNNLPSDGRIDITYKLIDTDREKTVKTSTVLSKSYTGKSANISVPNTTINATTGEATVLNEHKIQLLIEVYDSNSNKQLSKKDETDLFLLEHILINRTDPLNTTDNLVGWWPLHGNSARDYSGGGNNASTNNSVTFGVDGPNSSKAVDIDIGNYIQIGDNSKLSGMSEITVSVWANPDSAVNSNIFAKEGNQAGNWGINSGFDGGGVEVYLANSDGSAIGFSIEDSFDFDQWNHYVFTWDGENVSSYKNGNLKETRSFSGSSVLDNVNPVMFGANAQKSQNYYDGQIADGRLYNRVLSQQEIRTLYQKGSESS